MNDYTDHLWKYIDNINCTNIQFYYVVSCDSWTVLTIEVSSYNPSVIQALYSDNYSGKQTTPLWHVSFPINKYFEIIYSHFQLNEKFLEHEDLQLFSEDTERICS